MATVLATPPALAPLARAPLTGRDGATTTGSALWATRPSVIYVLRRPGCVLCRATAARIAALAPQLESMGVGLACVANAWLPAEVEAFVDGYWPLPVYLDSEQAFFAAVGGGTVRRGSLTSFLNPFSRSWKNAKAAKAAGAAGNMTGDGLTMGGLLAVKKGDGGVVFAAQETDFGDAPTDDQVLAAARAAAGKQ
jgi:predicted dithiol-disulfide oxidoreductase (DUF899 family)